MVMVGKYFDKRRGLATLLASVGISIGALSFPPLVQYLLDKYGLQGVLMVLAGIVFNFTVTGALLRPTTFYSERKAKLKEGQNEDKYKVNKNRKLNGLHVEMELTLLAKDDDKEEPKVFRSHEHFPVEYIERSRTYSDTIGMKKWRKRSNEEKQQSSSIPTLKHFIDTLSKISASDINGSLLSIPGAHLETFDEQVYKDQNNIGRSHGLCCTRIPGTMKSILLQIFNKDVLCNRLFMMFMLVACMSIVGMAQINMFLPAHSEDIGISKKDVALLLTIMGSLDLVSKILLAFIADLNFIKRHHLLAIASIITGIVVNFVHFFKDFYTMLILVITFGLFGQTYGGMHPVIVADFVGVKHLSSAMGIVTLLHGSMVSITSPIIGNSSVSYCISV